MPLWPDAPSTQAATTSRANCLTRDESLRAHFAATSFPTTDPTPTAGMVVFRTDLDQFYNYNGAKWVCIEPGFRNRLINSAFQFNQRAPATNADGTYCFDEVYILTQTGTVAVSQLTDPEAGRPFGMRITQSQASAQRFGFAMPVTAANIKDLRSKAVAMANRLRCSSSQPIKMAILEWPGTADTITKDVVNDWTSTTYTNAGGAFFITTVNVIAVGEQTPSAATWTDFDQITGSFGASLNNAIVFVWTKGTAAQNVTLDCDEIQLEHGVAVSAFQRRPASIEFALCQASYEKSFPPGTTPAQNAGTTGALGFPQSTAASTGGGYGPFGFRVPKRIAPTITLFNPSAANAQIYNTGPGTDFTSTAAFNADTHSFMLTATSPAATNIGSLCRLHFVADAAL